MAIRNYVRDTIITGFEITRATHNKVPMLLLSNPGLAKTTIINEIAQHEGMRVVSLIGSGFENNEILGFQVNEEGKDYLTTKNPTWYQTILNNKKEGISTILFIDEISVCPSLVQGALYRLIFERTIGNGKMLPEDTVIISAGNYKANLPSYCDITAPALNRFCIINLESPDFHSFLDEFSQNEEERFAEWPVFNHDSGRFEEFMPKASAAAKKMMEEVFECYSDSRDNSKGFLDIRNKDFAPCFEGIYSKYGQVYNFISGRTYFYLQQGIAACAALNVPLNPAKNPFVDRLVEGLIGAGTATFNDANQCKAYIKTVADKVRYIIKYLKNNETGVLFDKADIFGDAKTIADKVEKLELYIDGTQANDVDTRKALGELYSQIIETYDTDSHKWLEKNIGAAVDEGKRQVAYSNFVADIAAVDTLVKLCENLPQNAEVEVAKTGLQKIVDNFKFYAETVA
jgi:hypothetical protein